MMARRHHIGSIRGSSTANQSASRVVHPEFGCWVAMDTDDGSWTQANFSGNMTAHSSGANGIAFTQDYTKDDNNGNGLGGQWKADRNPCDRFYKKLVGPAGVVKWTDKFGIEFLIIRHSNDGAYKDGVNVMVADANVKTSRGTAAGTNAGAAFAHWGVGAWNHVTNGGITCLLQQGDTQSNHATNAAGRKAYASWGINSDENDADGLYQIRKGHLILFNDADANMTAQTASDATGTGVEADGGDVYLCVAPSFYGTTSASANVTSTWKIFYRLSFYADALSPSWVQGGRGARFGGMALP